ncbi:MAG: hypothetical protein VX914_07970, partial [Pseudomonadota bacterium]|nr:hypothetical protein [Pseudomonadota bacterium]
ENLSVNVNINNLLNERGVLSWQGAGDFNGLDRSFSPVDGLWSVVHQQPRSIFLTITYAMD